jgi:uncharacterized membrane protein
MSLFFGKKKPFLDADAQHRVVTAIKEAESKTTGEVRVFIEHHCKYVNAMHRAQEIFLSLSMDKTAYKNAVLIYIALSDRQFALYGDEQIFHKAGGAAFWKKAADQLKGHLGRNDITTGLCHCIQELGAALAQHFPFDEAVKKNELPDEIVFGK